MTAPNVPLRIGVALGGGSARGFAHIGALSALERNGFAPDLVVGTSFGAIVGALYAAGLTPKEIAETANSVRWRDLSRVLDFGLHKAALFSGDKLETYLGELVEGRSFSDLKRTLVVVATDLTTGERVDLSTGLLARALRASASMPGVFSPVAVDGRLLVDGGLGSPLPLATLDGYDLDVALGIGAGMEGGDSGAIRFAQRCLTTRWGQRVHRGLRDHPGVHPMRQLGRSLAHTMTAWQTPAVLADDALFVHTRPPISWFNFRGAEVAMTAGDAALEGYIPTLRQALRTYDAASL
ncbi:MAG: Patatin [uncultured Truepera sp.]|uniref:Patatin n=1 Tax=uncultured Truepera sp. TaxID=543023 RepID=A0A6J4VVB1_9DEIN|nr:MAG: Patatin [uncultured Truepera sp.]